MGYYTMLKQISCDKFLENGHIRKPIEFHPGLNTVMGEKMLLTQLVSLHFFLSSILFSEEVTM